MDADRVVRAAEALVDDVKRRHPDEELRCPLMRELDEALDAVRASTTMTFTETRAAAAAELPLGAAAAELVAIARASYEGEFPERLDLSVTLEYGPRGGNDDG